MRMTQIRVVVATCGAVAVVAISCAHGVDRDESNVVATGGSTTSAGGAGGQSVASSVVASSSTGMMCDEQPCKLVAPQCGCASGEACTWAAGTRSCVPEGTDEPGDVCSGNSCKAGSLCLNVGTLATCLEFCASNADCDGFGGICIMQIQGYEEPTDPTFCSANCDPPSGTGCPMPGKCTLALSETMVFYTVCSSAGMGTQGAPCAGTSITECSSGFGCFNNPNTSMKECLQYCNTASPSCPTATQCVGLNPAAIIGSIEYGACL
jgi:hypothetical protein